MKNSFCEAVLRLEELAIAAVNESPQISSMARVRIFNDAIRVLGDDMTEIDRNLAYQYIGARVLSALCGQARGALATRRELAGIAVITNDYDCWPT